MLRVSARTCRDCRCPRTTILRRPRIELPLRSARYRWHSKNRTAPAPTRCRCGTLHPFGAVESRIGWVFTALLPAREPPIELGSGVAALLARVSGQAVRLEPRRADGGSEVLSAFAGASKVRSVWTSHPPPRRWNAHSDLGVSRCQRAASTAAPACQEHSKRPDSEYCNPRERQLSDRLSRRLFMARRDGSAGVGATRDLVHQRPLRGQPRTSAVVHVRTLTR